MVDRFFTLSIADNDVHYELAPDCYTPLIHHLRHTQTVSETRWNTFAMYNGRLNATIHSCTFWEQNVTATSFLMAHTPKITFSLQFCLSMEQNMLKFLQFLYEHYRVWIYRAPQGSLTEEWLLSKPWWPSDGRLLIVERLWNISCLGNRGGWWRIVASLLSLFRRRIFRSN